MKIFITKTEIKSYLSSLKEQNKSIGFVPTMGALHQGHLSLIKKAQQKNDLVVVSVFVNPTQFDKKEDLINYPKTIENDTKLLKSVSCDVLFLPSVEEIYDNNVTSERFDFDGLEHQMEGEFREGHFDGVGTIVKTLFEIITPNKAYFGEKDFQQLQIIKKMVAKHRLDVKVKGCPIFREEDGLAMSSRNTRLTEAHRNAAPFIYETLKKVRKKFGTNNALELTEWVKNQFKKQPLLDIEYFMIADEKTLKPTKYQESDKKYRAFIAVFAGNIRLIDNISLHKD
ncbi:pantoate--beta-alanine ligase [Polaribacter sp. WD7]|uniref:pantoate--beta-alanine ligase n=1 Tax=Polaribacter sp. WD7 TaxID=2269061 RepID=UPI000DF2AF6D|nr:pantoate--beta-alanine ligase [Polaribacter sp. WD7]RCS28346.1 pantoate--beta-alanine ligase [Polaribacter sp. WD7]